MPKRRRKGNSAEVEARLEEWRAKTPVEQLADLDRRLGVGIGARKQRKRIQAQIKRTRNG